MSETTSPEMISFLQETISACQKAKQQLRLEGQKDESNFEQIRINVCEIWRAVDAAGSRQFEQTPEQYQHFLKERLDQLQHTWTNALNLARDHGDPEQSLIEQIKLSQLGEIRAVWQRDWKESK